MQVRVCDMIRDRGERTCAVFKHDGWAIVLCDNRACGIHNAGKLVSCGRFNCAIAQNVGLWHDHHVTWHEGADVSHDHKSAGFMQNAGFNLHIKKVGQLAALEFSTKWAISHWILPGSYRQPEK